MISNNYQAKAAKLTTYESLDFSCFVTYFFTINWTNKILRLFSAQGQKEWLFSAQKLAYSREGKFENRCKKT